MLILKRSEQESLILHGMGQLEGNVEIIILGIKTDRVKIGVKAPDKIMIIRKELLNIQTAKHNFEAASRTKKENIIRMTGQKKKRMRVVNTFPDNLLSNYW